VRQAVEAALAPYRTSGGGVRLEDSFRYCWPEPEATAAAALLNWSSAGLRS
jgi:hypothetical protein